MEPIVELRGAELQHFLTLMSQAIVQDAGHTPVYSMHLAIDDGGIKVKVNGYTWSPAIGLIQ